MEKFHCTKNQAAREFTLQQQQKQQNNNKNYYNNSKITPIEMTYSYTYQAGKK